MHKYFTSIKITLTVPNIQPIVKSSSVNIFLQVSWYTSGSLNKCMDGWNKHHYTRQYRSEVKFQLVHSIHIIYVMFIKILCNKIHTYVVAWMKTGQY